MAHETGQSDQGYIPTKADEAMAEHLARGETRENSAILAGKSLRTIQRRLKEPWFRELINTARDELISVASGILSRYSAEAAQVLADLLKSEDEKIRLQAAKSLTEMVIKVREHDSLAKRIEDLEKRAKERGN